MFCYVLLFNLLCSVTYYYWTFYVILHSVMLSNANNLHIHSFVIKFMMKFIKFEGEMFWIICQFVCALFELN